MTEIIHFTPKAELTATENVAAFIDMARNQLTVFGTDLPFDCMAWDITEHSRRRGMSHRQSITFCTMGTARSKAKKDKTAKTPMAEPFGVFAKACVRYLQGLRPTLNPALRVAALRAIEKALVENNGAADPVRIDAGVLNRACQIVKGHFEESTAYRIGAQLELIAELLHEKRFTVVPTAWHNPLARPSDTDRVGKEFEEERNRNMPSPAALEAVAIAFRTATEPRDVIGISAAALMCSAPDRIGEVLTLPARCEIQRPRPGNNEAYGLRWWPAKGADPMIKWIVPSMEGIVKEALARIRRHTDGARRIAAWYEATPERLYLPEDLEHLRRSDFIPFADAAFLLGLQNDTEQAIQVGVRAWAQRNGVEIRPHHGRPALDFAGFERAVVVMLPNGFPILDHQTGLKYSEALFVVPYDLFRGSSRPHRCMITPVDQANVATCLGGRVHHGTSSVFSRLGLTESDGTPIKINSHQFRHWLNTLAQRGGLSQLDIAKWSGRRDVRQNRAYDHMTSAELVELVRKSVADDDQLFGEIAAFSPNVPVSRDEYARMLVPTGHSTEVGICVHDFAALPCQLHQDCINCAENVCIKGDITKTERLRQRLAVDREFLANAESAASRKLHGADRWLEHHRTTVGRLEQLLTIMEDPSIPDGTVVRLAPGPGQSFLLHPDQARTTAALPPEFPNGSAQGVLALEDLRDAMNGME